MMAMELLLVICGFLAAALAANPDGKFNKHLPFIVPMFQTITEYILIDFLEVNLNSDQI